jgi:hypothetical protein
MQRSIPYYQNLSNSYQQNNKSFFKNSFPDENKAEMSARTTACISR